MADASPFRETKDLVTHVQVSLSAAYPTLKDAPATHEDLSRLLDDFAADLQSFQDLGRDRKFLFDAGPVLENCQAELKDAARIVKPDATSKKPPAKKQEVELQELIHLLKSHLKELREHYLSALMRKQLRDASAYSVNIPRLPVS